MARINHERLNKNSKAKVFDKPKKKSRKRSPADRLATLEQRNLMRKLGLEFTDKTSLRQARLAIFNALEAKKTK